MNDAQATRSLRELIRILFAHGMLIVLIVIVGAAGTYYACENWVPRVYRSEISLIFKRPQDRNPVSTDQAGERTLEVFVKAQQQIVMSDLVLARTYVIARDPRLLEQWRDLRRQWRRAVQSAGSGAADSGSAIAAWLDETVAPRVQDVLAHRQRELKKFRDNVELETPGGEQVAMSQTFTIQVDGAGPRGDPQAHLFPHRAADVLADMYVFRYRRLQQELNDPAKRVMDDVVESYVRNDLQAATDAYNAFVVENADKIGVLEQLLKSGAEHGIQSVLSAIRQDDARLSLKLARDKAIYDVMRRAIPEAAMKPGGIAAMKAGAVRDALSRLSVDWLQDNVLITELTKNLAVLEARRARLETQYTPESRDVQYVSEQIDRSRRKLLEAVAAYVQGLQAGVEAREAQMAMHGELVAKASAEQSEIQSKLAEYARLKSDFEVARRHLERLQRERIEAESLQKIVGQVVTVSRLDEPSIPDPDRPVMPRTWLYTAVAFFVSLLIAVALAFLADHFDHSLRSSVEAERHLGLPVLGSVKRRGRRLVVPG